MYHGLTMIAASGELDPMDHVLPHYLFGSSWFTNFHLMSIVSLLVGFALLIPAARRMQPKPEQGAKGFVVRGAFVQVIQVLCLFIRNNVAKPLLGDMTDRYIPYLWSTFFFILIGNVLGLIPFGSFFMLTLGEKWSHFTGTMTGNLAFTGGLAFIAFIAMHGIAIREQGTIYFKHAWPVPMKPLWLSWLLFVVNVLVLFLELILGPLIKAFALAVRLFANMVAGHLVLGSLVILIITAPLLGKGTGVLGVALFLFLKLFVAFLQAYIFTFLLTIFISLGASHHDEHDEHEHEMVDGEPVTQA